MSRYTGDSSMKKVIIVGAAGRDFHNFNVVFRNNPEFSVIAFTATQIPDIANRCYPAVLAGDLYPNGTGLRTSRARDKLLTRQSYQTGCKYEPLEKKR